MYQNSILTRRRMIFRHMLPSHSGPEVVMSDSNLVVLMRTKVNPQTSFLRTQSLCRRLQNSLGHSEPMITIVLRLYHHLQASKSRTVQDFLEWKQGRSLMGGEGCQAKGLTLPHFIHNLHVTFETAVQFVRQTSKHGTSSMDGPIVSHPIHQLQHSSLRN